MSDHAITAYLFVGIVQSTMQLEHITADAHKAIDEQRIDLGREAECEDYYGKKSGLS